MVRLNKRWAEGKKTQSVPGRGERLYFYSNSRAVAGKRLKKTGTKGGKSKGKKNSWEASLGARKGGKQTSSTNSDEIKGDCLKGTVPRSGGSDGGRSNGKEYYVRQRPPSGRKIKVSREKKQKA